MGKEKRENGSTAEKKAKKRKLPGTEETAPPIDPANAEPPAKVLKVSSTEKKTLLSPIAVPLADDKLKKRVFKLVKAAAKGKHLRRGVKEVVKALRKQGKGLCIIAGDISPIDMITHLPILCEDKDIPYIYVPSKEELGAAGQTKRPSSCMLLLREAEKGGLSGDDLKAYQELYDQVHDKMKAVQVIY